jgi:hypothetical protein
METVNNVRWLRRFEPEHTLACRCPACAKRLTPKIAAVVIVFLAAAAWTLVAAVILSLV